jgi:hypothetical protein
MWVERTSIEWMSFQSIHIEQCGDAEFATRKQFKGWHVTTTFNGYKNKTKNSTNSSWAIQGNSRTKVPC